MTYALEWTELRSVGVWQSPSESLSMFHDGLSGGCESVSLIFAQCIRVIMKNFD